MIMSNTPAATRKLLAKRATLWLCTALCAPLILRDAASAYSATPEWQSHVSARVLEVWKSYQRQTNPSAQAGSASIAGAEARFDDTGRVQVDVAFDCTQSAPTQALTTAGLMIATTVKVPPLCVVQGWATPGSIPMMATIASVKRIDLPRYSHHRPMQPPHSQATSSLQQILSASGPPAIDGNGIAIMRTDQYQAQTGVSGSGVTIAIISDDVTNLSVIQGRGELPAAVNVVQPGANPTPHSTRTDEGTMMLEEVHAVAPGALLAFCGPENVTEYVACVQNLIAAGATVIADDISYSGEDVMSTQGVVTQAIASLLNSNSNVMLFSAAANNALGYWQGSYNPVRYSGATLGCNGQTDNYLQSWGPGLITNQLTVRANPSPEVELAWANPAGNDSSNYDLYAFDASGNLVACASTGDSNDFGSEGSTNYVLIPSGRFAAGTYQLVIGTPDASLSGRFLKLLYYSDSTVDKLAVTTPGGTYTPQALAAGDITVGAVDGGDGVGRNIEPFSNRGPIQLEVPTASTIQSPIAVAPDDVFVDNVGTDFSTSNGAFFGTSAASPNMASVAVLLRSAFPSLTPAQTLSALESGAAALGASTPNGTYGYGRVDAVGALNALPVPSIAAIDNQTITGGMSGQIALTLNGTGVLSLTGSSDNSALIAIGATGGVSVSPTGCGTTTDRCTLAVAPTLGQVGTAHLSIEAIDGANRTATAQFTVTVIKPAPPDITATSGASQSFAPGGAAAPVNFMLRGTAPLNVAVSNSNSSLLSTVTLNNGCGTSTLVCTATLAVASGQTGASTLTITVTDPYSQAASATATLQVAAASKGGGGGGGGGAMDLLTLIALASAWLLRLKCAGADRR